MNRTRHCVMILMLVGCASGEESTDDTGARGGAGGVSVAPADAASEKPGDPPCDLGFDFEQGSQPFDNNPYVGGTDSMGELSVVADPTGDGNQVLQIPISGFKMGQRAEIRTFLEHAFTVLDVRGSVRLRMESSEATALLDGRLFAIAPGNGYHFLGGGRLREGQWVTVGATGSQATPANGLVVQFELTDGGPWSGIVSVDDIVCGSEAEQPTGSLQQVGSAAGVGGAPGIQPGGGGATGYAGASGAGGAE